MSAIHTTAGLGSPSIGQKCLVWDLDYKAWILAYWVRSYPHSNLGQFEDFNDVIDWEKRQFRAINWGAWQALPPDFVPQNLSPAKD